SFRGCRGGQADSADPILQEQVDHVDHVGLGLHADDGGSAPALASRGLCPPAFITRRSHDPAPSTRAIASLEPGSVFPRERRPPSVPAVSTPAIPVAARPP